MHDTSTSSNPLNSTYWRFYIPCQLSCVQQHLAESLRNVYIHKKQSWALSETMCFSWLSWRFYTSLYQPTMSVVKLCGPCGNGLFTQQTATICNIYNLQFLHDLCIHGIPNAHAAATFTKVARSPNIYNSQCRTNPVSMAVCDTCGRTVFAINYTCLNNR